MPTRFLINQCQIITFLILKSDIIENSRIELRGIVLPVPSNQIKVTFIIILPFNLVHLLFFSLFHIEIEGKGGWIIGAGVGGGGGRQGQMGVSWPPCPPTPLGGGRQGQMGGSWPPLFLRLCSINSILELPNHRIKTQTQSTIQKPLQIDKVSLVQLLVS